MIKIHIGLKGSGKTPKLIEAVNAAIEIEKGNVVCITEGTRLMHDISKKARMVNTEGFDVRSMEMFEGMLCGIIAQDYDVTHIFIDSVFKSVPKATMADLEAFIANLEKLEEKFNVDIKPLFYEENKFNDKKTMLMAGGEIPDLIYELDPLHVVQDVDQEFVVEVPYETIKEYAPEYYAYLSEYAPAAWIYSRYEDKNWGVPNFNHSHMESQQAIYRGDWLKKFGLEVPKTLEEAHTALYKFANEDPDGNGEKDTYGITTGQTNASFFSSVFGAYGCLPFNWQEVDGKIVYGGVTDDCKEALKTLATWYSEGIIHPEFFIKSVDISTEQIGADFSGGYQNTASKASKVGKLKEINPKGELVYGFLPTGPDGESGSRKWGRACHVASFGKTEGYGVKVPRMLEIIEGIFTDKELYKEIRIGKEGVNWEKANPNTTSGDNFVMLPGFGGNSVDETRLAGLDKNFAAPAMFTPVATDYDTYMSTKSDAFKAYVSEWTDEKYCLTDYFFKVDVVPSSVDYFMDLSAKQMALMTEIIQGVKPVEAYDEFIQLWENGGGKIMTEEANDLKKDLENIYKEIGVK